MIPVNIGRFWLCEALSSCILIFYIGVWTKPCPIFSLRSYNQTFEGGGGAVPNWISLKFAQDTAGQFCLLKSTPTGRVHFEMWKRPPGLYAFIRYRATSPEKKAPPPRNPLGPYAWSHCRILAGCVFLQVRYPCDNLWGGLNLAKSWLAVQEAKGE